MLNLLGVTIFFHGEVGEGCSVKCGSAWYITSSLVCASMFRTTNNNDP